MKKLVVIALSFLFLTGCLMPFDVTTWDEEEKEESKECYLLTSQDSFAVNGNVYTDVKVTLPVSVYNPNTYEIKVICLDVEHQIQAHQTITIEEEVQ